MYDLKNKEEITLEKYSIIKRMSVLILDMFTKNLTPELYNNIKEFKKEMINIKSSCSTLEIGDEYDFESLFQKLNYFLSENMYKQSSVVIRELIRDIFKVEYKRDDLEIIDNVFAPTDNPKIFKKYIEVNRSIEDLINTSEEKELKDTDSLFTTYKSEYPYDKGTSYQALKDIALSHGRLKIYERFFLWFSDYYSLYNNSNIELMGNNNCLPICWKYYIAIMAVSTIRCDYLLKDLEIQFLLKGGDESWLVYGSIKIPEKLKNLEKINNILAHQPWKLKLQDINDIYSKNESNLWNINELIIAVLIMTNYHRLASIVESLRLKTFEKSAIEEIDLSNYNKTNYCKLLKRISDDDFKTILYSELEIINKNNEKNIIHKIESFPRKFSDEHHKKNRSFETLTNNHNNTLYNKYISSYCTVYQDFDSHSDEFISYIEFNWQDHAVHILRNFYPKSVSALNAEIEYITTISSNNIGGDSTKLDTGQYRHTICTYVEKIFGYVNESFDYSKTNKLLHRTHKQFIKNVACFPQRITKLDIEILKVTFSPEEIFHIILLVSVAKMRLELTFFTRHLYEIIKSIE